ncbi:MAG: hypothetical protein NBV67_04475 [Tagaea sp.]|nr:hypothetical protein [Tagaea sp.]
MVRDGVIRNYVVAGAVAAINYSEPVLTEDLDVLVSFDGPPSGLIDLTPQYRYLESRGYTRFEKEGVVIDGWPVQFLPVVDDQDLDAIASADVVAIDELRVPILSAIHVVLAAIRTGRSKDFLRIDQFLEERLVDLAALRAAISRFGLIDNWRTFLRKSGRDDPFAPSLIP